MANFKAILFFLLLLAMVVWDLVVSEPINPTVQPTIAIFSSEKTIGGHCSFEVKE